MSLIDSVVDWIWLGKESLRLRISQYKPPKLKGKQKKRLKKKPRTEYPRTVGHLQKIIYMHNGNTRMRRKREEQKNISNNNEGD